LRDLSEDKTIVIRAADKGAALVVLDRKDYLREGYRQLSDKKSYKELESDPTECFRLEVRNKLEDMYQDGEIDITVRDYLMDPVCKTSNLYFLPKIHKGINPPPGRPVVSGNGCPTEKISQFVDHFLNPTTKKIRSYVKDTTHFLNILKEVGEIPPGSLLVTLDVESLYPNIPNKEGIEAARRALNRSRPDISVKPSNRSLIELLTMVLKKNNFRFNGKNYLQIRGTAIGTKAAPGYANNLMGEFERLFVYLFHNQPTLWLRFIDDIFMIWNHGEDKLNEFIEYLNSCMETIKFTYECSKTAVSFLDTTVYIAGGKLETTLYSKPTDSHSYLRYNSAHPQRCKDSIPIWTILEIEENLQ
jgi:hypothetical protein